MSRITTHLRGNAVGYVALFFALSGSAYALSAGSVNSQHIASNAVLSKHVKNGQIKKGDLARDSVNSAKVVDGSLGEADINLASLPLELDGVNGSPGGTTPVQFGETDPNDAAVLRMSRPGRALVFAMVESFAPACTSPHPACYGDLGLYVDEAPLDGTAIVHWSYGPASSHHTLIGVTGRLPAGDHTIATRTRQSWQADEFNMDTRNLGAIALGQ